MVLVVDIFWNYRTAIFTDQLIDNAPAHQRFKKCKCRKDQRNPTMHPNTIY